MKCALSLCLMAAGCHSLDPDAGRYYASSARVAQSNEAPRVEAQSHGPAARPSLTEAANAVTALESGPASLAAQARAVSEEVPQQPLEPFPERACRIAVLGDSLTDPKSSGGGYLRVIQRACPTCAIDNFGKGASMVVQMRYRFEHSVAPVIERYSHLIVFGGVNDMYSDETASRTPQKVAKDLSRIYEKARAAGTRVIAINIAPWGGFKRYFNKRRGVATIEVNSWLEQQAQVGHIDHVIDAYSALSCGVPERLCPHFEWPFKDGIHFGPAGHEVLGRLLVEKVFSQCPSLPEAEGALGRSTAVPAPEVGSARRGANADERFMEAASPRRGARE